VNQTGIF